MVKHSWAFLSVMSMAVAYWFYYAKIDAPNSQMSYFFVLAAILLGIAYVGSDYSKKE